MERTVGKRYEYRGGQSAKPRRNWRGVVGPDALRAGIAQAEDEHSAANEVGLSGQPLADCYPERDMPIAGGVPEFMTWTADESEEGASLGQLQERYQRFCDVRSELLRGYCLNTARAYWGDLDEVWRWAEEREKDVLVLDDKDVKQYVALLRRRKYSESTIRRRVTSIGALRHYTSRHRRE